MEDQPKDNKAKAGNEQSEQYQQLEIDGGKPKVLKSTTYIFSANLYGSNMCWEALGPYHSWDKILQSMIRIKIPEDMI